MWRRNRSGIGLGWGMGLIGALLAVGPVAGGGDAAPAGRLNGQLAEEVGRAVGRGLEFLKATQQSDGGWPGFQGSDPAITALAVKCFAEHADYGPKHAVVRRGFDYILKYVQEDGGIYAPEAGLPNYYTSVAVMALCRGEEPRVKTAVANAQQYLVKLQWDEGEDYTRDNAFYGGAGYGKSKRPDLSNTQMMIEALRESGLSPEHPVYKRALVFISRCQMLPETNDQSFAAGGDGGFIYTVANGGESKAGTEEVGGQTRLRSYGSMTYAGFKSLLYAGVGRDDPRVRAALDWIRRHYTLEENPNMPGAQSKDGLFYYYHVFARALAAAGESTIEDGAGVRHDWRADLCRKLLALQRSDGSWVNENDRWYEANPHLVTAYAVLALETAAKQAEMQRAGPGRRVRDTMPGETAAGAASE